MISSQAAEPAPLQIDSWQKAETNAAAWMRAWGYHDAHCTGGGPDGGVDIGSRRAVGQVKFEAAAVGTPALQRLVGARALSFDKTLFFFSGAGYASKAVAYAETMDIALFKYDLLGRMTAHSTAARGVLAQAKAGRGQGLLRDGGSGAVHPGRRSVHYGDAGHPAATSKKSGRGWLGRNWTLLLAVYLTCAIVTNLGHLISTPTGQNWFNVIVSVAGAMAFTMVWIRSKEKRARWRMERDRGIEPPRPAGLWTESGPRAPRPGGTPAPRE